MFEYNYLLLLSFVRMCACDWKHNCKHNTTTAGWGNKQITIENVFYKIHLSFHSSKDFLGLQLCWRNFEIDFLFCGLIFWISRPVVCFIINSSSKTWFYWILQRNSSLIFGPPATDALLHLQSLFFKATLKELPKKYSIYLFICTNGRHPSKSLNKLLFPTTLLQSLFISTFCTVQMFCFQFKLFLMKLPELSFLQTHTHHSIPFHSMPCHFIASSSSDFLSEWIIIHLLSALNWHC